MTRPTPQDTIAAVATPPGAGGIGVVRVSGPAVPTLVKAIVGRPLRPRYAHYRPFLAADGSAMDHGIALFFPAPASFTGEHVLELHGHGGPIVLNLILKRLIAVGARLAKPGEFSERAFLNNKLDLTQAEAIADVIAAGSEAAARAAVHSLAGAFSRQIATCQQIITELRVDVEAAFDFPDDALEAVADAKRERTLADLCARLAVLLSQAQQGQRLRDGLTLALVGKPNVGKSSLLNALVGADVAIVTELPGTTRDVLHQAFEIDGIPIHIADTAGLREATDVAEQEGVRRAREVLQQADHILLVVDCQSDDIPLDVNLPPGRPLTIVHNKIDLTDHSPELRLAGGTYHVHVSAVTGAGLSVLRQHLLAIAGVEVAAEGAFTARTRHYEALSRVSQHVEQGLVQLRDHQAYELVAEELRLAHRYLGSITGEFTTEDLLGAIFSSFCIGK